jgi:hypothetical protein
MANLKAAEALGLTVGPVAGVSVDNSDMGKMLPMNDALSVHSRRRAMATALAPPDWAAIHRELKRKHVTLSLRVTYGPYVTQTVRRVHT